MSLLGRLEDLSLTDIVQIVYLSRRTGVLEIINSAGRHTVCSARAGRQRRLAGASRPGLVPPAARSSSPARTRPSLRQMEDSGIPAGTAILEMNLLSADDLANAIRAAHPRPSSRRCCRARRGSSTSSSATTMSAADLEYDPDADLQGRRASRRNRLLGSAEGEKIKPLKGLEESLKAGKALLRGCCIRRHDARLAEPRPRAAALRHRRRRHAHPHPHRAVPDESTPTSCSFRSRTLIAAREEVHADRAAGHVHARRSRRTQAAGAALASPRPARPRASSKSRADCSKSSRPRRSSATSCSSSATRSCASPRGARSRSRA